LRRESSKYDIEDYLEFKDLLFTGIEDQQNQRTVFQELAVV